MLSRSKEDLAADRAYAIALHTTAEKFQKRLAFVREHEHNFGALVESAETLEEAALMLFLEHAGEDTPDDLAAPRREFEAAKKDVEKLRHPRGPGDDVVHNAFEAMAQAFDADDKSKCNEQTLYRMEALIEIFKLDPVPRRFPQTT